MIAADDRVNGAFYVSVTYNYMINQGKHVYIHHIPVDQHWAVGTPKDLARYLECR
jgi:hypothetical protein